MSPKQPKQPCNLNGTSIFFRNIPNLPVEYPPKVLPETKMTGMEMPTGPSLNAKHSLKAAERNTKWGNYGIKPIDNARDVTCGVVYVDVILQEVVVLEGHGIVWPEEKWKALPDLIQLGL